jgi:hypothetical protein
MRSGGAPGDSAPNFYEFFIIEGRVSHGTLIFGRGKVGSCQLVLVTKLTAVSKQDAARFRRIPAG